MADGFGMKVVRLHLLQSSFGMTVGIHLNLGVYTLTIKGGASIIIVTWSGLTYVSGDRGHFYMIASKHCATINYIYDVINHTYVFFIEVTNYLKLDVYIVITGNNRLYFGINTLFLIHLQESSTFNQSILIACYLGSRHSYFRNSNN